MFFFNLYGPVGREKVCKATVRGFNHGIGYNFLHSIPETIQKFAYFGKNRDLWFVNFRDSPR